MSGLRIYINTGDMNVPLEREVFYSHRAGGPYYRWCCEEKSGQWSFLRVHPFVATLKALRVTSLKDAPLALRVKLDEHYSYV